MPSADKVVQFPCYFVQSDWSDHALKSENIWLSSKGFNGEKAKNYQLITTNKTIVKESPNEDFEIKSYSNKRLIIQDNSSKVTHRFLSQQKTFSSLHKKSVCSLDVAPSGIAVSASTDGSLIVWDTYSGGIKHNLKGHYLDVNRCRFFPSHEVILSAGADLQLKIWSAIDGECPVTLTGHKGGVHDIAFVDRGHNVISVGRDGLVKLWSCGKACLVEDIFDLSSDSHPGANLSINACAIKSIRDNHFDLGKRSEGQNEDAVGIADKLLIIGTESGFVYGIGVNSKKSVFKIECESAVNCVTFVGEYNFAYGTQSGMIYQSDIRKPNQPICCWNYSSSPVLSMIMVKVPFCGLVVGRQDGTVNFLYDNTSEVVHLTGSDCDPIYQIAFDDKFIYTSCRDGNVRKYFLNNAFE